jgi:hypothetical protein
VRSRRQASRLCRRNFKIFYKERLQARQVHPQPHQPVLRRQKKYDQKRKDHLLLRYSKVRHLRPDRHPNKDHSNAR